MQILKVNQKKPRYLLVRLEMENTCFLKWDKTQFDLFWVLQETFWDDARKAVSRGNSHGFYFLFFYFYEGSYCGILLVCRDFGGDEFVK